MKLPTLGEVRKHSTDQCLAVKKHDPAKYQKGYDWVQRQSMGKYGLFLDEYLWAVMCCEFWVQYHNGLVQKVNGTYAAPPFSVPDAIDACVKKYGITNGVIMSMYSPFLRGKDYDFADVINRLPKGHPSPPPIGTPVQPKSTVVPPKEVPFGLTPERIKEIRGSSNYQNGCDCEQCKYIRGLDTLIEDDIYKDNSKASSLSRYTGKYRPNYARTAMMADEDRTQWWNRVMK